jgi:adenylate cyclase
MEQSLNLYDPQQHHRHAFLYWTDQGIHASSYMPIILWQLGYSDQASKWISKVMTLARKLSHDYSLAMAMTYVTFFHSYRRETDKTREMAEELIEYSTENRFPILLGCGKVMRFWALGMEKKENSIIDKMHQAIEELHSIKFDNIKELFLCLLAEVCAKSGQIEEGLTTLEEAQAWMSKSGERFWEVEIYRLKGELLLLHSSKNQTDAIQYFHKALDVSRRQQAKSLELRAAMCLSRLWQSQGKIDKARNLLSEIYGWFAEGFDTADLKDAKALLEELS